MGAPNSVSGLVFWLDGSDTSTMTLTGTRVDSWRDKYASGVNFVTGSSGVSLNPRYDSTLYSGKGGVKFVQATPNFLVTNTSISSVARNNYTVIYAVKRKSQTSYYMISDTGGTGQPLAGWGLDNRIGSESVTKSAVGGSLTTPYVYAMSWNGTTGNTYLNGKAYPLVMISGLSAAATACGPLEIGGDYPRNNAWSDVEVAGVALYSRQLSDADVLSVSNYLQDYYGIASPYTATRNIIFDGNSIVEGGPNNTILDFTGVSAASLGLGFQDYFNYGISGQTTAQMVTAGVSRIDPQYNAALRSSYNIVCFFEITNDLLTTQNAVTSQANVKAYCLARRAAGFKVVVGTCLPRTGQYAGFEADRLAVNAWIRANYTNFADALADIGNDATIGQTGQASNATYYSDGTHPTTAGHAIVATYFQAAITALTTAKGYSMNPPDKSKLDATETQKFAFNDLTGAVKTIPGFLVANVGRTINAAYPTSTTETYTYLDNGTTLFVLTVTYTDSTKALIQSVTRSS